jgi:hypothetical protein
MDALELVRLTPLMQLSSGRSEIAIALIDGDAAARGVIVVAAAGNQGEVGGSPLSRHPWPIPVAGSDSLGRPSASSNLGHSRWMVFHR